MKKFLLQNIFKRTYSTPSHVYEQRVERGHIRRDIRQENVIKIMDDFYHSLKSNKPTKSLYVYGGVGTGKTMMMDILFDCCTFIQFKQRTHFNKFMLNFHSKKHQLRRENPGHDHIPTIIESIAKESKLLCFDEFQVTDIADAMIIKRLFEGLLSKGVHIVCTSNRKPEDLYYNGINRSVFLPFIDLVRHKYEVIDMESGNDYRLGGTKTTNVYITPVNNQQLEKLFEQLTASSSPPEPMFLDVKGRTIMVPLASKGVAKFSFSDLCVEKYAAQDYIKICENFHTILISDIPYFNLNMRDVMRRFILLIDELYQHKIKLICTAVDKPENLFKDNTPKNEFENIDEAFAFDRTISRLNEMQTQQYLVSNKKSL